MQLEEANGGDPDPEARQALLRLQGSLEALDAAKSRNIDNDANTIPEPASLPQQMEVLQGRMGHLERRLEELNPATQQILENTAGEWLDSQLNRDSSQLADGLLHDEEDKPTEGGNRSSGNGPG